MLGPARSAGARRVPRMCRLCKAPAQSGTARAARQPSAGAVAPPPQEPSDRAGAAGYFDHGRLAAQANRSPGGERGRIDDDRSDWPQGRHDARLHRRRRVGPGDGDRGSAEPRHPGEGGGSRRLSRRAGRLRQPQALAASASRWPVTTPRPRSSRASRWSSSASPTAKARTSRRAPSSRSTSSRRARSSTSRARRSARASPAP